MTNTKFNGYKVDERCLLSFKLDGVEPDKREDTIYVLEFFDYLRSLPNELKEKFL